VEEHCQWAGLVTVLKERSAGAIIQVDSPQPKGLQPDQPEQKPAKYLKYHITL
jgi:hypothetical protein